MSIKCQIKWVDAAGKPTPDENYAIGMVQLEAHSFTFPSGRTVNMPQSVPFAVCSHHAARLSEPGMHHWKFTPFKFTFVVE